MSRSLSLFFLRRILFASAVLGILCLEPAAILRAQDPPPNANPAPNTPPVAAPIPVAPPADAPSPTQAKPPVAPPQPKPTPPAPPKTRPVNLPPSRIPLSLQPWQEWATWDDELLDAPPAFDQADQRLPLWPSRLQLAVRPAGGEFELEVKVFSPAWLALPGDESTWPQEVRSGEKPLVVVEREKRPAVKLEPGPHRLTGVFAWKPMPQRIAIPPQIGMLSLKVDDKPIEVPNWDEAGFLWLKRTQAEETEREMLDTRVYRVLEDGIPMWLRTEIELSVAGKSREEDLGDILPQAGGKWTIASVESPLPCAVDESGRVKAQVRAGKWSIGIDAFRAAPAGTVGYEENASPVAAEEIVGFRARPEFRVVELTGIPPIDVSQTTFPEKWRNLPVFHWKSGDGFQIEEKMRGMGFRKPSGLSVQREFWLDDDGGLMTFRDELKGEAQQVWRLDVSPGQNLGAVRMRGEGQLITKNPATGASGIEVRDRNLELEAVGRIGDARSFPASGWQADVDKCSATLHLPPGWRVLALLGAQSVQGDWLRAWDLLDLFLLLIFAMAVGKLWGWGPALIAILGFGLTYHEPGAPKTLWFFLLVPLAILRVVPSGKLRKLIAVWKWIAVATLVVYLAPFVGSQVQGVIYPQLEPLSGGAPRYQGFDGLGAVASVADAARSQEQAPSKMMGRKVAVKEAVNLLYDSQARIQTGPAIPSWTWRTVTFGWKGPVTPEESVRVVLIPPPLQSAITLVRVFLVILLAAILMDARRLLPPFLRRKEGGGPKPPKLPGSSNPAATALVLLALVATAAVAPAARAEDYPPQALLNTLRERLLQPSDAFPHAAEIPKASLKLTGQTLEMGAEIHAAARTAVPLPGKLPAWSPVAVEEDGKPLEAVGRRDGYLWVALEPGIHNIRVKGLLPKVTEWEWTFLLKPRQVEIEAPGWKVTGVNPAGVPEEQVFFAVQAPAASTEAAYDRKDFTPALELERALEIGLVWKVRTTLRRLSAGTKAVALSIPLLPGERVLSSNFTVADGALQVRLGGNQKEISWSSELPPIDQLTLSSAENQAWVDSWRLTASPVWNVSFTGLEPVYEAGAAGLQPVWRPWPGETTGLAFSKPEAVPGATMTVRGVEHQTDVGSRRRVSTLKLNLQASLGQDFVLALDPAADVTGLQITDELHPDGAQQPVRRDGEKVIIPVRPGEQTIDLEWKINRPISVREKVDRLELPVESANITTTLDLPGDRWILWADGPLRGPAVRLWSVALLAVIVAFVLGRLGSTPLGGLAWGFLVLGLTQVHPGAGITVVAWFFLLAWRGSDSGMELRPFLFNVLQLVIIAAAVPVVLTVLAVLHRGLLGTPDMMVEGNGSYGTHLKWFAQRTEGDLPEAEAITVSIWWYRFLMLAWALWLAASSLRWIRWGWEQFSRQTIFKPLRTKVKKENQNATQQG